ncbi:MAG: hypothetical protein M1840_003318 [Geoglossum simile]|nr:MAG: hypothetical protein M1840_003318 [Geoglossum simile]
MTTNLPDPPLEFYPSYCFTNSSTYHVWAKLTAADVHALTALPEFMTQNTYFYLNHPIRWVCVTGVVVAIDEFEKRTILYLDDGSGEGIDIVCDRPLPLPKRVDTDPPTGASPPPTTPDISPIHVGSVIRAKGTITLFRNTRQICLKRVHILPDTTSEVRAWRVITKFRAEVLMRPWELGEGEVKELLAVAYGEGREKRKGKGRRTKEGVEGRGRDEEARKKKKKKKRENKSGTGPAADQENRKDENRGITRPDTTSPVKEERKKTKQKNKHRHLPNLDALGL